MATSSTNEGAAIPTFIVHIFRAGKSVASVSLDGMDALQVHMALASMFGHHTIIDWQQLCTAAPARVTVATGARVYIDPEPVSA